MHIKFYPTLQGHTQLTRLMLRSINRGATWDYEGSRCVSYVSVEAKFKEWFITRVDCSALISTFCLHRHNYPQKCPNWAHMAGHIGCNGENRKGYQEDAWPRRRKTMMVCSVMSPQGSNHCAFGRSSPQANNHSGFGWSIPQLWSKLRE